ncbi:HNH endonuclease signature motif containing protein [Comamonas sp. lk]|uniref:HNH endonuclease n=1 Tax=Comamonas sp. lk TaxID=2201272 RepID=UPI000EB3B1EA|nr:HNH endonuclease signature motif containing protein [Comamonas sp. lk]
MALFIQKPIYWNTKGYKGPSGYPVTADSWPMDHGYGHEEWNNDPRLTLKTKHSDLRFFHTEAVQIGEEQQYAGQTFVFMMVSYEGKQLFVGIAGNATYLGADELKKQRLEIGNLLDVDSFKDETWALEHVRDTYSDNHKQFLKNWKLNLNWITNWVCPESHYWWFDEPIEISSEKVRGTQRWLSMFSRYTKLSEVNALDMMNLIPEHKRSQKWEVLYDAMASAMDIETPSELQIDGEDDDADDLLSKISLVDARMGQGGYRTALLRAWDGMCALTGIKCPEMLVASHIKPWSESNKREKLDVENGLLLSANVDSLFDRFLISFEDDGTLLTSSKLPAGTMKLAGLDGFTKLRSRPSTVTASYLKYHREHFKQRA